MKERALSVDALRGYAIITMVLSASIVSGILPGWMYHTQTPPPSHAFNPDIPGLTWVDLVFPTFLFAMGAAFPFSIGKKIEKGTTKQKLALSALWRGVLLTYFAILIQHFYPYMTGGRVTSWWLAIFCFCLLFPIYMRLPRKVPGWLRTIVQLSAMVIGYVAILCIDYPDGYTFSLHTSNVIILILANMAVFASLLYLFTYNQPRLRIAILMLLFMVMISATVTDSWADKFMSCSPITWFYNPLYLKYLFIVIPGAFAGEILAKWQSECQGKEENNPNTFKVWCILVVAILIVVVNLYCLYMRFMGLNMILNSLLLIGGWLILRNLAGYGSLWKKLFIAGAFLILLGLSIEPLEGGIKKDPVTFSYLFTTSGLSFMTLIFFSILCDFFRSHKGTAFLVLSGQNPMIAYVADNLLIVPVLLLCGVWDYFSIFNTSPWLGFLQGIIITSMAVLITMFFTKINFLWRT